MTENQFITIAGQRYRLVPVNEKDLSPIARLKAKEYQVTITGKVLRDWGLNNFVRKNDGTEGKVHSLLIGDEGGTIKVALWQENADAVKGVVVNDTILITGGYTKDGVVKDGKQFIELHVGKGGHVAIVPKEE